MPSPFITSPCPEVAVSTCDHVAPEWASGRRKILGKDRKRISSLALHSFPTHVLPVSLESNLSLWAWEVTEANGWSVRERGGRYTRELRSTWKSHPDLPRCREQVGQAPACRCFSLRRREPIAGFCKIHRPYQEKRLDTFTICWNMEVWLLMETHRVVERARTWESDGFCSELELSYRLTTRLGVLRKLFNLSEPQLSHLQNGILARSGYSNMYLMNWF